MKVSYLVKRGDRILGYICMPNRDGGEGLLLALRLQSFISKADSFRLQHGEDGEIFVWNRDRRTDDAVLYEVST